MSKSYWRYIAAIAGLALTAHALAKPVHNTPCANTNSNHAQTLATCPPEPLVFTAIQSNTERIAKALEAQNAHNDSPDERKRDAANLSAQSDMAVAARWTVVVASVEAGITLVGVILVGWTLYHTKRAANAAKEGANQAKRSADAAFDAIGVAEDTAKRQLRAYVYVEACTLDVINDRIGSHIRAGVHFNNSGQTPAYNLTVRFNWLALGPNETLPIDFSFPDRHRQIAECVRPAPSPRITLANAIRNSEIITLNDEEVADLKLADEGQRQIYVYGAIDYVDVFKKNRFTPFCFVYDPNPPAGVVPFAYYERHNTPEDD